MAATYVLKRGFTLIELLIAMSIMLAMLVLSGTAYQLYSNAWQRDLSNIHQSYQHFRYTELLLDAMQGLIPLAVTNQGSDAYYFLGREEGFTAVTYSPMFNVGFPAVVRVFRERNEKGLYRLIYEEASLQHTVLRDAGQTLPFSHRQVVMDDLPVLEFSYFGWQDSQTRAVAYGDIDVSVSQAPNWHAEYDSIVRKLHPEKIRLELDNFSLQFSLPDRSRLSISREDLENPV